MKAYNLSLKKEHALIKKKKKKGRIKVDSEFCDLLLFCKNLDEQKIYAR